MDFVVFGATGFTGAEVCKALARSQARQKRRWGIAGRSAEKLGAVLEACREQGGEPDGVIIADSSDHAALVEMAKQAKVVLNCTGPYRFLGDAVVKACIEAGSHVCDLCGEPEFYDNTLLQRHEDAVKAGVLIVHAAAWCDTDASALTYP